MKILRKTDKTHQAASRANKARADYLANYGPQATLCWQQSEHSFCIIQVLTSRKQQNPSFLTSRLKILKQELYQKLTV